MKNNQNDKSNQQNDSKSKQTETNKKEFNPNNPLAYNSKQKITPQSIQQRQNLSTTADITSSPTKSTKNLEKNNLTDSKKTIVYDSKQKNKIKDLT